MLSKNRVILVFILSLIPILSFSKNRTTSSEPCTFLGSEPSFIIKYKNISSRKQPELNQTVINNLSTTSATFTRARAMSGDAYIVFFTPLESLLSQQILPTCYSQSAIDELINEIKQKNKDIEYIDPNILMTTTEIKKAFFSPVISAKQWNLLSPPGGIDAQTAFNTTMGNPNAITAVLDNGILPNNSLTPNLFSNGVTFNNNGSHSIGASPSCDSSCSGNNHGTHVSGIVAASGVLAYGESIFGVAPTSKILPINVFTKFINPIDCFPFAPPCLKSYQMDQVNAINWLHGSSFSGLPNAPLITTVNMSLGGTGSCSTSMQKAMDQLFAKNISIAVAAGNGTNNDGIPVNANTQTPANCNGVMAIAATGPAGFGAPYSNYGTIIPFAAPGGDITGGVIDEIYSTGENRYFYDQGTSMASPHVAGLSALLYSLDPTLTPDKILNLIQTTTTCFPSGGPGNSCTTSRPCGTGIINANAAVRATRDQAPLLLWNPILTVTINNKNQVTLNWNPAVWNPSRSTQIVYTANINGVNVANCQAIPFISCVVNNLSPNIVYTVFVQATDVRMIYGPLQSASLQFTTFVLTAPTLTVADRNPLITTQAFIYYSSLGNSTASSFSINGVPGASLTLDSNKGRFIVSNITNPKQINNVTITANFSGTLVNSNPITIPSILGK